MYSSEVPTTLSLVLVNLLEQLKYSERDFPGGPVAKTPLSQGREPEFDPWVGNKDPACCVAKIEEEGKKDNVLN